MKTRHITYWAIMFGMVLCGLASIWDVQPYKWWLSAAYLYLVGRYFGLSWKTEKVKGEYIVRKDKELYFINLKNRK